MLYCDSFRGTDIALTCSELSPGLDLAPPRYNVGLASQRPCFDLSQWRLRRLLIEVRQASEPCCHREVACWVEMQMWLPVAVSECRE